MGKILRIGNVEIGSDETFALIAGPCVIENVDTTFGIAKTLQELTSAHDIPFIFKASFDKANRTSMDSFRGPGRRRGLDILGQIKADLGIPVLSDVHGVDDLAEAAEVLDVIQIPAFLCRQTDLIVAAAEAGKPINIKKGQFLAPWDMKNVVKKAASTGNHHIMITDRGTMFGYNNLVVDFRGFSIMQQTGYPVIFDATHSIQLPGGEGARSGGQREFAPILARSAIAAGVNGIFMEVHPDPDRALCDGPNSLHLDSVGALLSQLKAIKGALCRGNGK